MSNIQIILYCYKHKQLFSGIATGCRKGLNWVIPPSVLISSVITQKMEEFNLSGKFILLKYNFSTVHKQK